MKVFIIFEGIYETIGSVGGDEILLRVKAVYMPSGILLISCISERYVMNIRTLGGDNAVASLAWNVKNRWSFGEFSVAQIDSCVIVEYAVYDHCSNSKINNVGCVHR